jgi:transposase-like protein
MECLMKRRQFSASFKAEAVKLVREQLKKAVSFFAKESQ